MNQRESWSLRALSSSNIMFRTLVILLCVLVTLSHAGLSFDIQDRAPGGGQIAEGLRKQIEKLKAYIAQLEEELANCQAQLGQTPPPTDTELELQECLEDLEAEQGCTSRLRTGVWVPASNGAVPNEAIISGWDPNRPYWVGRASVDGNLIPCKLTPPHSTCWAPYNNTELNMKNYEALVQADVRWIASTSADPIPPRAVEAGWLNNASGNQTLYVGRAPYFYNNLNMLVPGYVFASNRVLLHSTSFKNEYRDQYEVLVYV